MKGFICINPNRINEEEKDLYRVGNSFSSSDKEIMINCNIEDCFRNKHAMTEDVVVFEVTGEDPGRQVADTHGDFINQYMFHKVSFDNILSREEIIKKGLELPSTRAPRFIASFKLTGEEIEAFITRFKNNGDVLRAIEYYQFGETEIYKEHEESLRKGGKH